jgi:hypothetical protein
MDCSIVSTDNIYNIAIIGVGQLGSRHLQGLAKSSKQFQISVVDPNAKSLIVAKQRFNEVSRFAKNNVSYHQNISDLPSEIDLAIIATTANVRRKVVENLLDWCVVKFLILEKVVFQKSEDFILIQELFFDKGVKSWVNCARRSFPLYKKIKNELGTDKLSIEVKGNNWGLACNGIHMIDLLAFLTEKTDIKIDTNELENIIFDSKRNGFKELKGTLKIQTSRGDILVLNDKDKYAENFEIFISNDSMQFNIFEDDGLVIRHITNNKTREEKISIPFQSDLTGSIVDQILDTGESDLTAYDECIKYHIPMLDTFNEHFTKVTRNTVETCPIT